MKPILEIKGISKKFRIHHEQPSYLSLRDSLTSFFHVRSKVKDEDFWALQNISFTVERGECIGIIGKNGAGKSTLLKILSKITPPTAGKIISRGRIASLLEVGTGFHAELSGKENIFLNGSILGMKHREIEKKFDEIVDFSGVEKFIDTPIKHYSSGMQLRLAFSVAAFLEPEILIIDEVLAVGDVEFQKKCLGKIDEVNKSGRTILFVSHNIGIVKNLCSKAVLLQDGEIVVYDKAANAINKYVVDHSTEIGYWKREKDCNSEMCFKEISLKDKNENISTHFNSNESFYLNIKLQIQKEINNAQVGARFTNQEGIPVFTTSDTDMNRKYQKYEKGICQFVIKIPANFLCPGAYKIDFGCYVIGVKEFDRVFDTLSFVIINVESHVGALGENRLGIVGPLLTWKMQTPVSADN